MIVIVLCLNSSVISLAYHIPGEFLTMKQKI